MGVGSTSPNPQSTRRVVAFFPPGRPEINVNVVCTNVGADYQKMGSFGRATQSEFDKACAVKCGEERRQQPPHSSQPALFPPAAHTPISTTAAPAPTRILRQRL